MQIGIVGAFRGTKLQAPYGDPDWQIYSLSPFNENELPRHDIWFEMHRRFLTNPDADGKEYGDWLRSLPVVSMIEQTPLVSGSVAYPIESMKALFGSQFFVSTITYMLARAISLNPKRIGIWGVEPSVPEYAHQRHAIQHFIHVARESGIDVTAPEGSTLLKPAKLYGYET